jgi:hypothetical protein
MWASPRLIPVLSGVAILSLIMSTYVVVRFAQSQSERERDRIESDYTGCERGNVLRGQVVELGEGVEDALYGVLSTVLDRVNPTTADELRAEFAPTLERLDAVVHDIEIIDCRSVVPGALEAP